VGSYVAYSNCFDNLVNNKMKRKYNFLDIIQIILTLILIVFSLFILYQIILKLFGDSWSIEQVILALLVANIGITFSLAVKQAKLSTQLLNLISQFRCLSSDFKLHQKK